MRKDMKHVIIDRPRIGGDGGKSIPPKGSKRRDQKIPLEELPNYQSTAPRRAYGYECKELNEHLNPLRRWLRSQVGRDWDEVWSEICSGLSIRNATTAHVRDHADQYVEKNCYFNEKGEICDSRGFPIIQDRYWGWEQFYVDPRDNTLQMAKGSGQGRRASPKKDWVEGKDENHRYYLLKGVWYEVELKPLPNQNPRRRGIRSRQGFYHIDYTHVHDVVIAARWDVKDGGRYAGSFEQDCKITHGSAVYAVAKRQLGKREIRKLKLWETEIGQNAKD